MKKTGGLFILFDLEGIIGIKDIFNDQNNILAYREIEFIVNIFKDAGYNHFTLCNIHNDGRCLDKKILRKMEITVIEGVEGLLFIDSNQFDSAIMIGFHGCIDSGGYFDHTFRADITSLMVGEVKLGEVGIFFRWLGIHGMRVIFVSGEGNFSGEIMNYQCITHSFIGPVKEENIDFEYQRLRKSIESAIFYANDSGSFLDRDGLVYITVDNTDKYYYLKDESYFLLEKNNFIFLSVTDFIAHLTDFAYALNSAIKKIYRNNLSFIDYLKSNASLDSLSNLADLYLSKDIFELNHEDRMKIAESIGIFYDDSISY